MTTRIYKTPKDVKEAIRTSKMYKTPRRGYWSIEILEGPHHGTYHGFSSERECEHFVECFKKYGWLINTDNL